MARGTPSTSRSAIRTPIGVWHLITELRQGIDRSQFFLEYQPILDLRTRAVVGVEALLRWNHPEQGRLLPSDFIEVAEQTGVINLLTPLVLEQAIGDWHGDPNPIQTVAVNLSPRNLHNPQLPDRIRDLLGARHTAPSVTDARDYRESDHVRSGSIDDLLDAPARDGRAPRHRRFRHRAIRP